LPKLIICREDLPKNPNWRLEGYPMESCWDVDEFMASPDVPYEEKRRIYWEAYWRLLGRYRRARPFFDVYLMDGRLERVSPEKWRWVSYNIIVSAMAHDVVPPWAKESAVRLYKRMFGRLAHAVVDLTKNLRLLLHL